LSSKKVVYLFGAGATIAKWQFALGETREELSLRGAPEWVITRAKEEEDFKESARGPASLSLSTQSS
jgi:hypothetical protein